MWDKQKCRYFRKRMLIEQMKVKEENNAEAYVNMIRSEWR